MSKFKGVSILQSGTTSEFHITILSRLTVRQRNRKLIDTGSVLYRMGTSGPRGQVPITVKQETFTHTVLQHIHREIKYEKSK